MAIDNFKERHTNVQPVKGLDMNEDMVGLSTESILEALGGTLEPLLDAIKDGTIRGITVLVSRPIDLYYNNNWHYE